MMEIGSPRLPLPKGKYQWSCIWGLVDMFDFRTGRTHQKRLSNGKTRHKHDARHSRKVDTLADFCEKCQGIEDGAGLGNHAVDAYKTKVKDIVQEEFPTEKQIQKLLKAMKQHQRKSDLADNHKASKTLKKASQMLANHRKEKDHEGHHPCSCSDELSLDNHKFAAMLEEIFSQIHQDGRFNGDIHRSLIPSRFKQLDEINVQLLQMSAKAFIDQIYIKRRYTSKDGVSSKSEPFSDASEILHVNRDLFLKLLQDPNSLLVKHIQKLQFPPREKKGINSSPSSQSSECQSSGTSDYEDSLSTMSIQKRNANKLPWQKLKQRYGFSSKRSTSSASNAIVVLKPGSNCRKMPENVSCHCSSLQSHHSLKNKRENSKSTYFSLKEIKRKLKRVGGESEREQRSISLGDGLNQLYRNKNSLKYVENGISPIISKGESRSVNDAKRMGKQPKPKGLISHKGPEIDFKNVSECNSSTTSCSNQQSDIFIEAKRHLSERFRNLNLAETLPRKQTPRTLQMILSLPDHDRLFTRSPKRDTSASASMLMRFFPYSDIEKGKGVSWPSPQKHNEEVQLSADSGSDDQMKTFEIRPNIPEKISDDIEGRENICATGDDLKPTGYMNDTEENESLLPGNMNILEVPCERDKVDRTCCGPSTESTKLLYDNGYKSSSLADSSEDHHHRSLLRPASSPLDISALEIVDACKYREGHPSPVSVLDPFSPEDANSPTSTTAKQDESPLQPRRIDFDDHLQVESLEDDPKVDIPASTDEEEYMSACVRAVMQASNFDFEELSAFSPCLPHVLNNLYSADSVGLFRVEANCELNLLLDCIHEVLLGIYSCYFGCSPWLSLLKPNIRPAPLEANVIEEVVKEVNCYISPKLGQPTLDQLVGMDMAKFGLWFELRPDAEDIAIQIAEDVLQESMMDTILELQI
ncbi:uncharacterized protein [Coffea arabica]|uniref:Uncharacterized protein isoform X2 n=1 Tax=Coffea arabica TaxID=13443 RepID=A0A6P6TPG5_COFAR|nr:uncharacterized protein LOC113703277 [Coffea arabica]XP_027080389.1 uncharacterized protein LOC113703277 [Coffea arabica]